MFTSATASKTSLSLLAMAVGCSQFVEAQNVKGDDVESYEARAAANALVKENGNLERQLREAEESKAGLQKNLAIATGEAEVLKRQLMELRLRLEAFGLEGQGSQAGLEQRLLSAVSALRTAEQQKTALATAVITLSDTLEKSSGLIPDLDLETRKLIESAVTQGRDALAAVQGSEAKDKATAEISPNAVEGVVLAIKEELALVVTSLGRSGGVKAGMPFRVIRGDQEIGFVRIVDVRDRISGAVVQELAAGFEKIRVGDKLKIGADRRM